VLTTASSMSSASGAAQVATKAYEAPERFKGEPKSTATDVYAFGVLMWEFATCDVPFADHPGLIDTLVLRGVRPIIPLPLPEGFPADYFKLMQECWSENPAHRPTAEHVHSRLLKMDPSARAVQGPLTLWHPSRTHAPASLLPSILSAMQAAPGQPHAHLAPMLEAMVADAARIVRSSAKVQQLMQQYHLTEMEAQAVSVYAPHP
jgi:serine/threonine protein kinase